MHQTSVQDYHQITEAGGGLYYTSSSILLDKDSKQPCSDKFATQHLMPLDWLRFAKFHSACHFPMVMWHIRQYCWFMILPVSKILCLFRVDDVANIHDRHWFLTYVIFLLIAVLASRVAFQGFFELTGIVCNVLTTFDTSMSNSSWIVQIIPATQSNVWLPLIRRNADARHIRKKWFLFLLLIKIIKILWELIWNQNHNSKNRFQIAISNHLIWNRTQHCIYVISGLGSTAGSVSD